MTRRTLSRSLAAGALALGVAASPAAAGPPAGDWTFLRKDAFRHYACKAKDRSNGGQWQVRTATWLNGDEEARRHEIGAYAALARRDDDNVVASRTVTRWQGQYIRMTLRGARDGDRIWLQGSYYGPAQPWSDGARVERLTRCARGA